MNTQQLLFDLWNWIIQADWLAITNSISTFGMLLVAVFALEVWRKQEKSKRTLDFFDKLTDAIHEYVYSMSAPIYKLEFIFIGINSLQSHRSLDNTLPYPEAIKFIANEGKENSSQLSHELTKCVESAFRIKSLIIKGSAMNIEGFKECHDACHEMLNQHELIQAFAIMIGMTNANWNNSEVTSRLGKVLEIKPQLIREKLSKNQIIYLNYVQNIYKNEYGLP